MEAHVTTHTINATEPVCESKDRDCQLRELRGSFPKHDLDESGCVNVSEVVMTLLDDARLMQAVKAHQELDDDELEIHADHELALKLVRENDFDGDECLDITEWVSTAEAAPRLVPQSAKSEVIDADTGGEAGLIAVNVSVREIGECIAKISKWVEVKWTESVSYNCIKSERREKCWKNWFQDKWWKPWEWRWECAWETIETTVTCWKDEIRSRWDKVWERVGASFDECYKNIVDALDATARELLPSNCHSAQDCKDSLLKSLDTLTGAAMKGLEAAKDKLLGKTAKAIDFAKGVMSERVQVVKDIGREMKGVGSTFKSAFDSLKAGANVPELDGCTPDNVGRWKFQPTDCGAFSVLGDLMSNLKDLAGTPSRFRSAKDKFAECIRKRSLLSLPTPFLDVVVDRYCVPGPVLSALQGIYGTAYSLGSAQGSIASACQHSSESTCLLVKQFLQIGDKLKGVAEKNSLMQLACSWYTEEWKSFLEMTVGVAGITGGFGVKFAVGCKGGNRFEDISVLFTPGEARGNGGFSFSPEVSFTAGAEVAEQPRKLTAWKAECAITADLPVAGFPVDNDVSFVFPFLPDRDSPRGFEANFIASLPSLPTALIQASVDDAVARANESDADKVLADISAAFAQVNARLSSEMVLHQLSPSAALQGGKGIEVSAGIDYEICLSCPMKN